MTLPASSNTISLSQVNTELGRSATATIDMNDSAVRSLFGKPGSGNTISMSDGWGKSNISISLPGLGIYGTAYPGESAYAELTFNSNGTITAGTSNSGTQSSGNWATPTTTGIGSSYWVRATQTGSYGTGGFGGATQYGSAKGVWHQISNTPYFGVSRTGNGMGGFYYTIQIASDSGGSNILATATNVEIAAEIIF
jgi:hypothetical protein